MSLIKSILDGIRSRLLVEVTKEKISELENIVIEIRGEKFEKIVIHFKLIL